MTPEQSFKQWFVSNRPQAWHVQCIESTTGRGIPDINLCANGLDIWLEFKAEGKRPQLRPEQIAWISRREASGGRAFALHRQTDGMWALYGAPFVELRPTAKGLLTVQDAPLATGTTIEELSKALTDETL